MKNINITNKSTRNTFKNTVSVFDFIDRPADSIFRKNFKMKKGVRHQTKKNIQSALRSIGKPQRSMSEYVKSQEV